MARRTKVVVKQDEEKPVTQEVLAEAIVNIGKATNKLLASGINQRAIVVLLHDHLKGHVGRPAIMAVLEALPELEQAYCTKKRKE